MNTLLGEYFFESGDTTLFGDAHRSENMSPTVLRRSAVCHKFVMWERESDLIENKRSSCCRNKVKSRIKAKNAEIERVRFFGIVIERFRKSFEVLPL